MDQVQQVSVQVAAANLGDVRTLIDALEAHRDSLAGQRGFAGLQIRRSSEEGGNTLITVETRWRDGNSLADYTMRGETASSIIQRHASITVPGTLDVRRMEAVDAEPSDTPVIYERLATALLLPIGIAAVGLAIIYSLSRVYLEIGPGNATTFLASGIAIGILLVAWYFAANPAPRWQYGSVGVAVAALLVTGTVWAQTSPGPAVHRGGETAEGSPTPDPNATPAPPGLVTIELNDNVVRVQGSEGDNPTFTVPTGATIPVVNVGAAVHNLHVAASGDFVGNPCAAGGADPCSDPPIIRGGQEGEIIFDLPPGTYDYRCDFHIGLMEGTVVVE